MLKWKSTAITAHFSISTQLPFVSNLQRFKFHGERFFFTAQQPYLIFEQWEDQMSANILKSTI